MSVDKQRRLGRGLEALISSAAIVSSQDAARREGAEADTPYHELPISAIRANRFQPRRDFKADELAELESSLKVSGLLQPITVRPAGPNAYELIAGERRLRAAARLGWERIPAVVKEIDDRTALTLALVENLQRTDLNPLEEAEGYQRLVDEFGLTQQQIADVVGKDRSTVANTLRILALPAAVRRMIAESLLSLGHARALLVLGNERAITSAAREVVARGLSVREVEKMARASSPKRSSTTTSVIEDTRPAEVRRIEDQLRKHLQTNVYIYVSGTDKGEVKIPFYSTDDLERLLDLLLGATRETL
jgi:ParB family transcriptional regulator, chromosome partitioning protein